MKKTCLVMAAVWLGLGGLASPPAAAYTAAEYFGYLTSVYDQHDKRLSEFLLAELDDFCRRFPDSPEVPEALYLMGQVHQENGDDHHCLALLMKTMFLYPESPFFGRAAGNAQVIVSTNKSYNEQRDDLIRLLNSPFQPGSPDQLNYEYVAFLNRLEQDKLADWTLDQYREFVGRFPQDPRAEEVQWWVAEAYIAQKEWRLAAASLLKYEVLFPEGRRVLAAMQRRAGLLDNRLKKPEEAQAILSRIVADYPHSEVAGNALFNRAQILASRDKDYDAAIADYRRLVTEMPAHPLAVDALFQIADIKAKRQKAYRSAISVYDEVVEDYPEDERGVEALQTSAKLELNRLHEPARSAERYARIASLYPGNPEAPEMLMEAGKICEKKLKDFRQAIVYYQRVVDEYPTSEQARDASQKIGKIREKQGISAGPEQGGEG